MEFNNFFLLRKFSPGYLHIGFIDTRDYLADSLFIKHRIRVRFKQECYKDGTDFIFVFCKIRKKDFCGFINALEDLKGKMILLGHPDYQEFCEEICRSVEALRRGEVVIS